MHVHGRRAAGLATGPRREAFERGGTAAASGTSVDAARPRSAARRWRRRALAAGVAALVTVTAGELALSGRKAFRPWPRFAPGEHPNELALSSFLQPDPDVGWSMRPSFEYRHVTSEYDVLYRSNAQGFRAERPLSDGAQGVLLVGDSYTFGIGVALEETYGARLEARLGTPVHDLAMPGFALDQMVLQVERALATLAPELVVVGLCDADLARSQTAYSIPNGLNKPAFRLEGGRLEPRTADDRSSAPIHFLEHRSRLWMALRQVLRHLGYRHPVGEWWTLNEALLERLRADCAAAGVPLVLVYVPTPECRPFPTLARWAARAGVPLVDLAEDMRGVEGLFWPEDRHFTPAGHARAAERLGQRIEEHLQPLLSHDR